MTYQVAVYWAAKILEGGPLPDWTPPRQEVIKKLRELEESLDRKSSRNRKPKNEPPDSLNLSTVGY